MSDAKAPSERGYKMLSDCLHDHIVVMQAAWIEWKHGKGAEAGMQWIENTLIGPGNLPGGEYDTEAQAWFDANQTDPLPRCGCGRPSNIGWMGRGFCSEAHYAVAKAAESAE